MTHDKEHTDDEMTHDKEHTDHEANDHEHGEGITGLGSDLDITITLNQEKTTLIMIEDENILGLYTAEYTPSATGFPTVHFFAEIDDEPIEIDFHPEKVEDGAVIRTATSDGSINVDVITTAPTADKDMLIKVEFTDALGNPIEHVNYDIVAIQDGSAVLTESSAHTHEGDVEYSTEALSSSDPVDIQVTILGIGLPDDEANWSGPMGDTISLNVVPEFGPIAMIVFAVATVSIVAMAAKSKIIPKL
jgi:predicted secreted protein with PEFG-CTERM motif